MTDNNDNVESPWVAALISSMRSSQISMCRNLAVNTICGKFEVLQDLLERVDDDGKPLLTTEQAIEILDKE